LFAFPWGSADDIGAQTGSDKKGSDGAIHRGSEDLAFVVESAGSDKTATAPYASRTGQVLQT
jgi:hypothetical protein